MRFLVIGGNGFIGSHIVDDLVDRGHEVAVFDRFRSSEPQFRSRGLEIIRGDFFDDDAVVRAVTGRSHVVHSLSTTTPATAEEDPSRDVATNIAAAVRLLEICARSDVAQFSYLSTGGAIYGDQERSTFDESALTLPRSPYGIGKLTVERYMDYFRTSHDLSTVALRVSNPYGPRQHPERRQGLIPIALRTIAEGRPVVRYGDGGMVRDYIFVRDAARMIGDVVTGGAHESVYNIGSGAGRSISQVLELIREVVGHPFPIEERRTPPSFVERSVLDISRYADEFGAPSLTHLRDGLVETWSAIRPGAATSGR